MLHDAEITIALVIKHGNDDGIQLGVKRFRVGSVVGYQIGRGEARFPDGPTGNALDVTFRPPAIQNAQAGHAI